ncbi:MAG: hypothetical protein AAGB51_07430 [Planctomycetota bacterium]
MTASSGDQFDQDLPGTPDLTDSILDRVEEQRAFITPTRRRRIVRGRLVFVGSVLALIAVTAMVNRIAPWTAGWTADVSPVTSVVEAGREDAARGAEKIRRATLELGPKLAEANVLAMPYQCDRELDGVRLVGSVEQCREFIAVSGDCNGNYRIECGREQATVPVVWSYYLPQCAVGGSVSDVWLVSARPMGVITPTAQPASARVGDGYLP